MPSGRVKGVDSEAHEEPDERRNPELTGTRAVASREESLIVDQRAATVRKQPNHVAVIVDYGDDESSDIREAILLINRQRAYVERALSANCHRRRQHGGTGEGEGGREDASAYETRGASMVSHGVTSFVVVPGKPHRSVRTSSRWTYAGLRLSGTPQLLSAGGSPATIAAMTRLMSATLSTRSFRPVLTCPTTPVTPAHC